MNIQIRHDQYIDGNARFIEFVQDTLKAEFSRQQERITHLEVHFSDENATKHGEHDKKCMIEVRISGLKPAAVSCKANTVELALQGAVDKLHHLIEHQFEKQAGPRHIATVRDMPLMEDALKLAE